MEETPIEAALQEMVDEALRQIKTFLIIIYGCCVRFYSTVVDWEYIQRMSEDLIERMTSKIFEDPAFSQLVVSLCGELTREQDQKYQQIKRDFQQCIPKDVGINPFFTLDHTSKIEQIFLQLHPELNLGDSGSIEGSDKQQRVNNGQISLQSSQGSTALAEIPEELMSEGRSTFKSTREQELNYMTNNRISNRPSTTSELTALVEQEEDKKEVSLTEIRRRMHNPETEPYSLCIKQLNKLDASQKNKALQTPMAKMNCISEISTFIKQEVHDFWNGVQVD